MICSPTDQHAGQIMAAAKAGKMIFCEKPISLSLEIIDQVRMCVCVCACFFLFFHVFVLVLYIVYHHVLVVVVGVSVGIGIGLMWF